MMIIDAMIEPKLVLGLASFLIGALLWRVSFLVYKRNKPFAGAVFFTGNVMLFSAIILGLQLIGFLTLSLWVLILYVLLISSLATHLFYKQIHFYYAYRNKSATYRFKREDFE